MPFFPSGPAAPKIASASFHRHIPAKPITSSHSAISPAGFRPSRRRAPVWAAWWPASPNATWIAIQPMITYITPRAASPARPRTSSVRLLAAWRPAGPALFLSRRPWRRVTEVIVGPPEDMHRVPRAGKGKQSGPHACRAVRPSGTDASGTDAEREPEYGRYRPVTGNTGLHGGRRLVNRAGGSRGCQAGW